MGQQQQPILEDKQQILDKVTPKAVLKALTPEAQDAVLGVQLIEGFVPILRFPYC